MPIRWNSILKGSWEITLSQILVRRSLDMGEESVSVTVPFKGEGSDWISCSFPCILLLRPQTTENADILCLCYLLDRSRDKPCTIVVVDHLCHVFGGV